MRTLFLLGLFGISAEAAYFDINGLPIDEGTQDSPDVYWPEIQKDETQWNGACTYYSYPVTLIKTWTGDAPADDTPAYGLMHPSAWANGDIPTSAARVLSNNTFFEEGLTVQINRYVDVSNELRENSTYSLRSVKISTYNTSIFAVVEFAETAKTLLADNMTFYAIAKTLPTLNSEITSISYWGPVMDLRTRRLSKGKFLGAVSSIKADTGYGKSYFAFRHSCNYFEDGSPLFNSDGELIGLSFLQDTEWNYANNIIGLDECFNPVTGLWDFNRKNCLHDYKKKFWDLHQFALPGLGKVCTVGRCLITLSENRTTSINGSNIASGSGGSGGSGSTIDNIISYEYRINETEYLGPMFKSESYSSLSIGSAFMVSLIATMFMF